VSIVITSLRPDTWDIIDRLDELIQELLLASTQAMNEAHINYAVIGGHAVHHWVSTISPIAARTSPNVNLMINHTDYQKCLDALCGLGFEQIPKNGQMRLVNPLDDFYPKNKRQRYVSIHFCNEMVNPVDHLPNPDLSDLVFNPLGYWVVSLETVTKMKLNAFRLIDRVHLIDLLQNGLIDNSLCHQLSSPLAARLKELCDLPEVKDYVETSVEEGN